MTQPRPFINFPRHRLQTIYASFRSSSFVGTNVSIYPKQRKRETQVRLTCSNIDRCTIARFKVVHGDQNGTGGEGSFNHDVVHYPVVALSIVARRGTRLARDSPTCYSREYLYNRVAINLYVSRLSGRVEARRSPCPGGVY